MSTPEAPRSNPEVLGETMAGMKRDWNTRATDNALHSIASDRIDWDSDEFFAQGRVVVSTVVDPVLTELAVDPSGKRVLEIGCGVGRLFEGYSTRFADVWGIDISSKMVELGQSICPVEATWVVGDGATLDGIPDSSIDHIVSYEVFQHIPSPMVIESYFSEMNRVLVANGTFQLQMRKGSDSVRQSVIRALPRPLRVRAGSMLHSIGALSVDGDVDTWLGCIISPSHGRAMATAAGFTDVADRPDIMHAHQRDMGYWLIGRKPGQPA